MSQGGVTDAGPVAAETFDPRAPGRARRRLLLVAGESLLVAGILLVWFLVDGVQESKSLWVFFAYSFPAEFLVGLVPHEPALIYFGAFHPAWIVAIVAAAGTVMAEAMNYSFIGYFYDRPSVRSAFDRPVVRKLVDWFGRAPFLTTVFAGITPVPYFPVRFLVVMTAYPLWKYLLAVFVARTPRFWLLAAFGAYLDLPVGLIGGIFLVMLLSVNVPALVQLLLRARE